MLKKWRKNVLKESIHDGNRFSVSGSCKFLNAFTLTSGMLKFKYSPVSF